jgi:nicotinamide-nucleotide amidase
MNASIITIGDELLIGQTIDTNSAWLGQQLNQIGVWVNRRVAVGDEKSEIEEALSAELKRNKIVIITGGLGPTADDITKPLLCNYFGGHLINNEAVEKHVRAFFEKRNRPMLDVNILQAQVPNVAQILWNRYGTAPGMLFTKNDALIFSLPGVPLEMKDIMLTSGLEKIKNTFDLPKIIHKTINTAGKGESFVAAMLQNTIATMPTEIKLAYLPNLGQVKLRLTGINVPEHLMIEWQNKIASQLGHLVFATEDISLQQAITNLLISKHKTIACAESCTGGLLGNTFTDISGSSNFFLGSAVCYNNQAKHTILGINYTIIETNTAVSEQVAIAMANGALQLYKSDIAIATTGYLESTTDGKEPQVWIAITDGVNTKTIYQPLPYARVKNKELVLSFTLRLLFSFLTDVNNN